MRAAILLPTGMAVRNFIETPAVRLLAEEEQLRVTFLMPHNVEEDSITGVSGNFSLKNIRRPSTHRLPPVSFSDWLKSVVYQFALFWYRGLIGYGILAYRFNEMHGFSGHLQKKHLCIRRKLREVSAGNFVFRFLGFPFSKNRWLYDRLYALYYSTWRRNGYVEAFFETFKPDVLLVTYPQHLSTHSYLICARRRGIPVLIQPGSWDRLTTKGPMPPDVEQYIALNQIMRSELIEYHNVLAERIEVVGWPQMDYLQQLEIIKEAKDFWRSLGIEPGEKVILYAANAARLGKHEPDIVRHLVTQIEQNRYGESCTLIIRPHPKDSKYWERFGEFASNPAVFLQEPQSGQIDVLANILHHADVVIATQGSVSVDAIGMDACVVNVAFDGDLEDVPYYSSIKRWYENDHYLPVVESGAVDVVENYEQLDNSVTSCLNDRNRKADQHQALHQILLEPFDGQASQRIVQVLMRML